MKSLCTLNNLSPGALKVQTSLANCYGDCRDAEVRGDEGNAGVRFRLRQAPGSASGTFPGNPPDYEMGERNPETDIGKRETPLGIQITDPNPDNR